VSKLSSRKPKSKKKKVSVRVSDYYKIDGDKLIRKNQFCTRCGPGVFMADMFDRYVCGKCGFTVFKKQPTRKSHK